MSVFRRIKRPGGVVFFSVCLAQRGSDLLVREIDLLRWCVGKTRGQLPFDVCAWTVMPDRMETIWRLPDGDSGYSRRWGAIKGRFSRGLSDAGRSPALRGVGRVSRGEVGIWQQRFWEHHIRGPEDLAHHLERCRMAPVRAGLVTRPEDWPYSDLARRSAQCGSAPAMPRVEPAPEPIVS